MGEWVSNGCRPGSQDQTLDKEVLCEFSFRFFLRPFPFRRALWRRSSATESSIRDPLPAGAKQHPVRTPTLILGTRGPKCGRRPAAGAAVRHRRRSPRRVCSWLQGDPDTPMPNPFWRRAATAISALPGPGHGHRLAGVLCLLKEASTALGVKCGSSLAFLRHSLFPYPHTQTGWASPLLQSAQTRCLGGLISSRPTVSLWATTSTTP